VLLSAWIVPLMWSFEEFGIVDAIFAGGVGPIGDGVSFRCDMGGKGDLTRRLTRGLQAGMVLAVGIMAEARMLEGVFAFGGVNVGLR